MADLTFQGNPVKLTTVQRDICWSLLKAFPNPVANTVIIDRAGSEGTHENVKVHVHFIRRKLKLLNAPNPIEACFHRNGGAYRWIT